MEKCCRLVANLAKAAWKLSPGGSEYSLALVGCMVPAVQKVKQFWMKTIKYGAHFQEDNFNKEVQLIGFKKE